MSFHSFGSFEVFLRRQRTSESEPKAVKRVPWRGGAAPVAPPVSYMTLGPAPRAPKGTITKLDRRKSLTLREPRAAQAAFFSRFEG